MIFKKGHEGTFVALLLLGFVILACNFSNDIDKANKLVAEANDEMKKIKKIREDSEGKVKELKSALDAKNVTGVQNALDDLIKMIDQGLGYGQIAGNKIDEASKLNIEKVNKEYLELNAQSIQRQIEAFEARKKSAQIFREAYGGTDSGKIEKAKDDFNKEKEKYERLMAEARDLSDKADKLQRENPTKIKSIS